MSFFGSKKPNVSNNKLNLQQTLAFHENIVEGNPDSDFAIYGFAQSWNVPRWVDADQQKLCGSCSDTLKSGCKHNCRLCGNVYCSRCTAKYNLPEKYDLKNKLGPSRVCYACRMSCIRMKQASLNLPLDSNQRPITAPTWQDTSSYVACNKCCIKRRNPHNCRCCGLLFCDDCSSKMKLNLPPAFNPKNKPPPHRVCDSCRFRLNSGAAFDDGSLAFQQQQINNTGLDFPHHDPVGIRGEAPSPLVQTSDATALRNALFDQDIPINFKNSANQPSQQQVIPAVNNNKPQSDVAQELSNVLGKLTIDPNLNNNNNQQQQTTIVQPPQPLATPTSSGTNNMKPIPLSQLAAEARLKGAKTNNELNTTPVSPGIVPTTVAEHRQLQRMKSFGTNGALSGISSSNTPSSTNGSGSQQAILTATGNTPRLNPVGGRPSISSVSSAGQFNFTTNQQQQQQQSSLTPQATTTSASATTKPRPAGARDIFSRASLAQHSNYIPSTTTQNKHIQQSLDDQKENEAMNDDTTRTSNIAHDGLVKPSALFNRNGNNNTLTNKPAYLQNEPNNLIGKR